MAIGLSDLVPDDLFFPNKKNEVIKFLRNVPASSTDKRSWLFLWALWVGSRINRFDYANVQQGSVDA
jgi:hypothetical protein